MTTALLPDIARGSLAPLSEAVDRAGPERTGRELRRLAEAYMGIVGLVEDFWKRQYADLENGADGRAFAATVNEFLDCLRTAEGLIAKVDVLAIAKGDEGLAVREVAAT